MSSSQLNSSPNVISSVDIEGGVDKTRGIIISKSMDYDLDLTQTFACTERDGMIVGRVVPVIYGKVLVKGERISARTSSTRKGDSFVPL